MLVICVIADLAGAPGGGGSLGGGLHSIAVLDAVVGQSHGSCHGVSAHACGLHKYDAQLAYQHEADSIRPRPSPY